MAARSTNTNKLQIIGMVSVGLVILSIAGLGERMYQKSNAATPYLSVEAENGTASGVAAGVSDAAASGGRAVGFGAGSTTPTPAPTMSLSVNGGNKYQVMDGFGTAINTASWDDGALKPALDMLINQNGSKIFRVVIEQADWEATNDDNNPANFNWVYYNSVYSNARFQEVWGTMAYLNSKGIKGDNLIISFMGQGPTWLGGRSLSQANEDEWVEMVSSMAYYARNTMHIDFSAFGANNEPDSGSFVEGIDMNPVQNARAMNKLSLMLDGLGMGDIKLPGPDTTSVSGAVSGYASQMSSQAALWPKVAHITGHTYSADTGGADATVKANYPGKNFWVSEFSIFDNVFSLLGQGPAALLTWDGYDSVYQHAIQNGLGSAPGNDAGNAPAMIAYSASTKTYTARKDLYNFGQLFKWVPAGMQRIGSTSSKSGVQTFAFMDNTKGTLTIFGRNNSGATQVIGGTLAGTPAGVSVLHYSQTNTTSNMAPGTDVPVSGGAFSVSVPNNTVFTLTSL